MLNRNTTCSFTGHRPDKLKISEQEAKKCLCTGIEYAIKLGYTTFITGMAPGVDLWAGELMLEFKNIYPKIKIVCAFPYPGFSSYNPSAIKISALADKISYISKEYSIYSYQKRNEWMVDNSSLVIALFNGEKGGTYNTIKYAEKKGVTVMNMLDDGPKQLSVM